MNARARSDQRIADSRHHHLDKNLVTTTARPETLIPGNCYFSLGYYDNDLVLPMVETLVYVGQEHYAEHGRTWLFKEPDSPPIPNEETEPPPLTAFTDRELHRIVDIEGLVRLLRELAADHPLKPLPQANVEPPTSEDFDAVVEEVTRFPETPEYNALTMVIQFTDDGLSLARREGGIEMQLDAHPRRHPGEDARILSLFASMGVEPRVDYLSDRGRTRVLGFPISSDADAIAVLCKRVFTEVYSMHRGDALDYHFLRTSDVDLRSL